MIKPLIDKIIARPALHSRWLNTLSMMENSGAKKIKNCEDPVFVNEIILKHAAEEARHAYYLKKQITKISEDACPTYEKKYLLAPCTSYQYLNLLDIHICRFLKHQMKFEGKRMRYAAYLLVTYAIEVRADALYPIYQQALSETGSNVSVKTIIAEEKNHLDEMILQLKEFSEDWQHLTDNAIRMEQLLFMKWIDELECVCQD